MSTNVQFEDEQPQFTSRRVFGEQIKPKMVTSLMKTGLVKNERQAGYMLLVFTVCAFALSLYLFKGSVSISVGTPTPPPGSLVPPSFR